jgi:hypothetical protein
MLVRKGVVVVEATHVHAQLHVVLEAVRIEGVVQRQPHQAQVVAYEGSIGMRDVSML